MLYAKINPKAVFPKQVDPFAIPDLLEAEYMTASATNYQLGVSENYFDVFFGNFSDGIGPSDLPIPVSFTYVGSIQMILTAEELANWGTSDEDLLTIIAAKLPTNIVEFVNLN